MVNQFTFHNPTISKNWSESSTQKVGRSFQKYLRKYLSINGVKWEGQWKEKYREENRSFPVLPQESIKTMFSKFNVYSTNPFVPHCRFNVNKNFSIRISFAECGKDKTTKYCSFYPFLRFFFFFLLEWRENIPSGFFIFLFFFLRRNNIP